MPGDCQARRREWAARQNRAPCPSIAGMAQLNLKDIDDELPAALKMVAQQNGVTVKDYCVEALRAAIDNDMEEHAWRERRARRPAFARDVVEGRIPACKWVRLTCQRHLKDLARKGPSVNKAVRSKASARRTLQRRVRREAPAARVAQLRGTRGRTHAKEHASGR